MPAFALDLDYAAIRLLVRDGGDWTVMDEVALDDSELPKRLRQMQLAAALQSDGPLETELIIPPSQILYTTIPAPADRARLRDDDIAAGLEGQTPCPVEELVFDWRREGERVRVAALDINTLDEAESFAATYGFNPVRFTARPAPEDFPDIPDFGPTQYAEHEPLQPKMPVFASQRSAKVTAAAENHSPTIAPAAPTERRTAPDRAVPVAPPKPSNGPMLAAVAALATIAILTWTALYLIKPRSGSDLPEIALTPTPETETEQAPEPRLTPRRAAPTLTAAQPLPLLPGHETDPKFGQEMTERHELALLVPAAPDPAKEVGVLKSADMWQRPPPPLIEPIPSTVEELYVASIDPIVKVDDAFALSPPASGTGTPVEPPPPPQPGQIFELDDRGLVQATPEGALTPDGVLVFAGPPPLRARPRPTTAVFVADPDVALALAGKVPRPRPADLGERMERALLGGRTRTELAAFRPRARPESAQETAVSEAAADPSPLAVAVSRAPSRRPADFAAIVAATQQARRNAEKAPDAQSAPTVKASAATVAPTKPSIPSSASVAKQATIENAINLRKINLIGVYGSPSDRRALVRLPSGRFVKVKVGDRIDGGQIAAIGDNEVRYIKSGRNITLTVPSG